MDELQFLKEEQTKIWKEIDKIRDNQGAYITSLGKVELRLEYVSKSVDTTNLNVEKMFTALEELKQKPAKRWDSIVLVMITSPISAVIGAIITHFAK